MPTIYASDIDRTVTQDRLYDDGVEQQWGAGAPASFFWETADADANYLAHELPAGGAVDVPVIVIGVGIDGVDLGHFDGITQPGSFLLDADRDSYVGFHYSADDVAVIRMRLAGGTVRNHTIPDVASDTLAVIGAAQTWSGTQTFTGDIDLNSSGTLLNVGVAGNDWTANTLAVSSDFAGTNEIRVENTSTTATHDARVTIMTPQASGGDAYLMFRAGSASGGDSYSIGQRSGDTTLYFVHSNDIADAQIAMSLDTSGNLDFQNAGSLINVGAAGNDWTGSNLTTAVAILLPNGSVGSPAISFSGDPNTGLYKAGTGDEILISTGGNLRWTFSNTLAASETDIDLQNNTLLNVGAAGNDWTTTSLTHVGDITVTRNAALAVDLRANGNDIVTLTLSADHDNSGGTAQDANVVFAHNGSTVFAQGYDGSGDRWYHGTATGATNNGWRMSNGTPPVITYNTSEPSGTFDFVCDRCGRHEADWFSCCGPVAWQDDAVLARRVMLGEASAIDQMCKIGVMERSVDDQGRPEVFTRLGMDVAFAYAIGYQNFSQIQTMKERLAELERETTEIRDLLEGKVI